jgi:hypothetical protein
MGDRPAPSLFQGSPAPHPARHNLFSVTNTWAAASGSHYEVIVHDADKEAQGVHIVGRRAWAQSLAALSGLGVLSRQLSFELFLCLMVVVYALGFMFYSQQPKRAPAAAQAAPSGLSDADVAAPAAPSPSPAPAAAAAAADTAAASPAPAPAVAASAAAALAAAGGRKKPRAGDGSSGDKETATVTATAQQAAAAPAAPAPAPPSSSAPAPRPQSGVAPAWPAGKDGLFPASSTMKPGVWSKATDSSFNVRLGPGYKQNKIKAPSLEAFYECSGADLFRCERITPNLGKHIALPGTRGAKPIDGIYRILMVNIMVPSYQAANPVWGRHPGNGHNWQACIYFSLRPEVATMLESTPCEEWSPGLRLLRRFCLSEDSDDNMRNRLKFIPRLEDVDALSGVINKPTMSMLKTYNCTPILTRPTHSLRKNDDFLCIDVNVHAFNYFLRKGIESCCEIFHNFIMHCGIVIEGIEDEELPERLLGCFILHGLDLMSAPMVRPVEGGGLDRIPAAKPFSTEADKIT